MVKESRGKLWMKQHLLNPGIKNWFASFRKTSGRIVYPIAPKLHEFVFIRLHQYLKRRYLRVNSPVFTRETLYSAPKSIPSNFKPKVSVIVPSYNAVNLLRQRLDSIYKQTYPNIEVILLDDASTDGSQEVLEEYGQRYTEITKCSFNKKNSGGRVNHWRRGLGMAEGDLIWIA